MKAKGFTLLELMICVATFAVAGIVIGAVCFAVSAYNRQTAVVTSDQPASTAKCVNGIVTRDGVAVKKANGGLMPC